MLKTFGEDHFSVAQYGIIAITNLTSSADIRNTLGGLNACQLIVQMLRLHAFKVRLWREGEGMLFCLCVLWHFVAFWTVFILFGGCWVMIVRNLFYHLLFTFSFSEHSFTLQLNFYFILTWHLNPAHCFTPHLL